MSKRSEKEIEVLGCGPLAGAVNVGGETANSLFLRWSWNKWLAARVERSNNAIARAIKKSPDLVKDLVRLFAVHQCWKWEKINFLFREN